MNAPRREQRSRSGSLPIFKLGEYTYTVPRIVTCTQTDRYFEREREREREREKEREKIIIVG